MSEDSVDNREAVKTILEEKSSNIASQFAKREEDLKKLVPPDLEVSSEAVDQVEKIVDSWEPSEQYPEKAFAREMVTSLFRRVDGWIPGNLAKKMQLSDSAREIRDALVSGDPHVLEKAWESTAKGAVESVRNDVSKAPLLSRVLARFRSVQADIDKAQEVVKGHETSIEELEWQQVEGDCMVAFLQAGDRPLVRKGIISTLSSIGLRLGRSENSSPEMFDKALRLVDGAVEPARPELLYRINKTIGSAKAP